MSPFVTVAQARIVRAFKWRLEVGEAGFRRHWWGKAGTTLSGLSTFLLCCSFSFSQGSVLLYLFTLSCDNFKDQDTKPKWRPQAPIRACCTLQCPQKTPSLHSNSMTGTTTSMALYVFVSHLSPTASAIAPKISTLKRAPLKSQNGWRSTTSQT